MTTAYGVSTSNGSQTFQAYVNAIINGPLTSNRSPHALPSHSDGILTAPKSTPPQFFPRQEPVNAEMNTNARAQYVRTNGIANKDTLPSSMYTSVRKNTAVGQYAYNTTPISTKNYSPNDAKRALRRSRSSGCTAPRKKGSIYNI